MLMWSASPKLSSPYRSISARLRTLLRLEPCNSNARSWTCDIVFSAPSFMGWVANDLPFVSMAECYHSVPHCLPQSCCELWDFNLGFRCMPRPCTEHQACHKRE